MILEGHPAGRIRPVSEVLVERLGAITQSESLSFDAATRAAWSDGPVFEVRAGFSWSIATQ